MTRNEALREAESCFLRVVRLSTQGTSEAASQKMLALAETGKGYVELAKELRAGS